MKDREKKSFHGTGTSQISMAERKNNKKIKTHNAENRTKGGTENRFKALRIPK